MDEISIMDEVIQEDMEALKELIMEDIKPLVKKRLEMEREIGNEAIAEMYRLEENLNGRS